MVCGVTSVCSRMASSMRPFRTLGFLLFAFAFINVCSSDNVFYEYEIDEYQPSFLDQPVLRLIKRETETEDKESKVPKKSTTESDLANSSNSKANNPALAAPVTNEDRANTTNGNESATQPPAPLNVTTASTTQSPPHTSSVGTPNVTFSDFDADGDNVTNPGNANVTEDAHRYYNSKTFLKAEEGKKYWFNLDNVDQSNVFTHDMLSHSHRRAATIPMSFEFPFYGHIVRNITIATGGFLYTGDYVHSWLAATQYIAPLMANFDTSVSNDSTIKYHDNGESFTVQWEQVVLQDRPLDGNFTFQATLYKNGDIVFAYKEVPIPVTSIGDDSHPVKVGVSDAYIIDRTIFFVRRKTIYEYHKVDLKTDKITNGTAIYFTALPTCVSMKSCEACTSNSTEFTCIWCPGAERCSDGTDRHLQDWLLKGCDKSFINETSVCNATTTTTTTTVSTTTLVAEAVSSTPVPQTTTPLPPRNSNAWDDLDPTASRVHNDSSERPKDSNVSSVIGILFLVGIILGSTGWLFYAYRNPHTPSGQCFIRYRPSQWKWRSGEAHYTAAAIHM